MAAKTKAVVTNGAISSQPTAGVKSVVGAAHTVAKDVNFPYRGQLISLRADEPFYADSALLAFCAANGITVTAN
jgi:hypothetical protein